MPHTLSLVAKAHLEDHNHHLDGRVNNFPLTPGGVSLCTGSSYLSHTQILVAIIWFHESPAQAPELSSRSIFRVLRSVFIQSHPLVIADHDRPSTCLYLLRPTPAHISRSLAN
jgi:hypothetical protein